VIFSTLIVFALVVGVLVLVHELGHFAAAKLAHIRVEEFGIGLPPRLWSRQKGETVYSLNALPFGGFVRLTGEDGSEAQDPHSFAAKPAWQRLVVLLAGVAMNLLLAVAVFTTVFSLGVPVPEKVTIEGVAPGTPAEKGGLRPGDVVLKFDGEEIHDGLALVDHTTKKLGQEVTLVVLREGEEKSLRVVPRRDYPEDQGPMGVTIKTHFGKHAYPVWQAALVGTKEALTLTAVMVRGIVQMASNWALHGQVPQDVAGPVGIARLTGEAAQAGVLPVLQLLGFLSLNLAIVNVLPLPALDGGRSFFVLVEMITGRRVHPKFERWTHAVGFVFLILLILLITVQDLSRLEPVYNLLSSLKTRLP
jgi:regulator of sigma E protease